MARHRRGRVPGVRRQARHGRQGPAVHVSRRGARRAAQEHVDRARGRRDRRHRRPSASGRPVDRPHPHPRRALDPPVPLQGRVLRARGRGLLGRVDDRHAADLARRAAQGRRAERLGHLRHQAGLLVRVDGDHADDVRSRRHRRRPVRHERRRRGRGHARAPAGERLPRRRPVRRPPRPARPSRPADSERRRHGRDPRLRLRAGRPQLDRTARPPGPRPARPRAHVREPRRQGHDLPHDHRVPGALQPDDGDRVPARGRQGGLRLRRARLRPRGLHAGGEPRHGGRRRRASRPAPTRTSAASTRSCAVRSRSSGAGRRPGMGRHPPPSHRPCNDFASC